MKELTTVELLRLIREAKRDKLYALYGNRWREHEIFGTFWHGHAVSAWEMEAMAYNAELIGFHEDNDYPLFKERTKASLKLPPLAVVS